MAGLRPPLRLQTMTASRSPAPPTGEPLTMKHSCSQFRPFLACFAFTAVAGLASMTGCAAPQEPSEGAASVDQPLQRGGLVVAGPTMPTSGVCDDFKPIYEGSVTTLGDQAQGLIVNAGTPYYSGVDKDGTYAIAIYDKTLLVYNIVKGDPNAPPEGCWTATYNYVTASSESWTYNLPSTCWSSAECKKALDPAWRPPAKIAR